MAAATTRTANPFEVVFSALLPYLIAAVLLRILLEILKSVRRRGGRRRHPSRKWELSARKREQSAGGLKDRLAFVCILAFFAVDAWLWMRDGIGGKVLAVAIVVAAIALPVLKTIWPRRKMPLRTLNSAVPQTVGRSVPNATCRTGDDPLDEHISVKILSDGDMVRRAGEKGESMVRETLKLLPADRYVVLHDVWLPMDDGDETQIDHVIVSIYGIFVIETKNWKGNIYADEKAAVWTKWWCGCKTTYMNPIRQNYKHLISLRQKFTRSGSEFIFGVVAMNPEADFKYGVPKGVVYYNELRGWILNHVDECIKEDQIADVVGAIREWSSMVTEAIRRRHCGVSE